MDDKLDGARNSKGFQSWQSLAKRGLRPSPFLACWGGIPAILAIPLIRVYQR
jgi:hypothetical protein